MKKIIFIILIAILGVLGYQNFYPKKALTPTLPDIQLRQNLASVVINNFEEIQQATPDHIFAYYEIQSEPITLKTLIGEQETETLVLNFIPQNAIAVITIEVVKSGYETSTSNITVDLSQPFEVTTQDLGNLPDYTRVVITGVVQGFYTPSTIFISDANGSATIYESAFDMSTIQKGDQIKVTAEKFTYYSAELINVSDVEILSQNNTITNPVVLGDNVNLIEYQSQLVTVRATATMLGSNYINFNYSFNETTLSLRAMNFDRTPLQVGFVQGQTYEITGILSIAGNFIYLQYYEDITMVA